MELFETQKPKDMGMAEADSGEESLVEEVVDAAILVHLTLGPGLPESVYEQCLACELKTRGLTVARQVAVGLIYRDVRLDVGFRLDLVVDRRVVVKVKACEKLLPTHKSQLQTQLKHAGLRRGTLINFNAPRLRDGLHHVAQAQAPLRLRASMFQSNDIPD